MIRAALQSVWNRPGAPVWGLAALSGASALAALLSVGLGLALLVVAGGALVLVIGLLWSSLHHLTGESGMTLEEALSLAAPSVEQEQKRAVLRALKDLEFERSVGKLSDEDYASLSTHYRNQAKDLIRSLDKDLEPARAEMEKLVQERVTSRARPDTRKKKKRPLLAPEAEAASSKPEPVASAEASASAVRDASPDSEPAPPDTANTPASAALSPEVPRETAHRVCEGCSVRNDPDARFCKACGAVLENDS